MNQVKTGRQFIDENAKNVLLEAARENLTPQEVLGLTREAVAEAYETVKNQVRITCKSGCGGCCRGGIPASSLEVADLIDHVSPEAWDRVRRNREGLNTRSPFTKCPLLDPATQNCTVYEHRPLICRGYNVTSNVKNCQMGAQGPVEVVMTTYLPAAIGHEASRWKDGEREPFMVLGEALVAELDRRETV